MGVSGIVMASGKSERFGSNKLYAPFRGKRLFELVMENLSRTELDECIVVSCYDDILNMAKDLQFKAVANSDFAQGQSASIRIGVTVASCKNSYAFFTCDQPVLSAYTINEMLRLSELNKEKIIVPRFGQRCGSPCIFPSQFRKELLNLSGDVGGKSIIKNNLDDVIYYNPENENEFLDADTPEDLFALENLYNQTARILL